MGACIITDLIYCLEQAKALSATTARAQVKVNQISTVLDELQTQQHPNPLLEKKEEASEVTVELPDQYSSSYSISAQQVDQIVQLQLEVLADCIIQKDIWCEGENGLNEL